MLRIALIVAVLFGGNLPVRDAGDDAGPSLIIRDAAGKESKFTMDDLAKLPQKKLQAKDPHSGATSEYEGVMLPDLLKASGVRFGKDLRGPLMASYVLAEANDGYRVLFSIGEVDPDTGDAQILVAIKKNGQAMAAPEGTIRFVLPADKRGARWIRQVKSISLHQLPAASDAKSK